MTEEMAHLAVIDPPHQLAAANLAPSLAPAHGRAAPLRL